MNTELRSKKFAVWGVFLFVLALECLHQGYLARTHPDAPYMDTLRLLHQLDAWQRGSFSLYDLWNQSAHRGLLFQSVLAANIRFLSLDVLFANRLTGLVILAVAWLIAWDFLRTRVSPPGSKISYIDAAVACLMAALCFGWAGFEVLTLDLGLSLWLKNLAFIAVFSAVGRNLAGEARGESAFTPVLLQAFAAIVIVLFMGMGWVYAFVGSLISVQLLVTVTRIFEGKPSWSRSAWVSVAAIGALVIYVVAGGGVNNSGSGMESKTSILASLSLLPYALGSTWIGVEGPANKLFHNQPALAFGLLSLILCVIAVVRRVRAGIFSGSLLPLYMISYTLLIAASLCVARGGSGSSGVMASRYYMDLVFLPIGTIWLWVEHANPSSSNKSRPSSIGLIGFCLLLLVGLLITGRTEWLTAPYRAAAFRSMNQELLNGATTESAAQLLQSPHDDAVAGAEVMAARRLSIFAHSPQIKPCSPDGLGFGAGWYAAEAGGVWASGIASLRVPSCSCSLEAKVFLPEDFKKRSVRITSGKGFELMVNLEPGVVVSTLLPPSKTALTYTITSSDVTVPSRDMRGGKDERTLSAFWATPTFSCQ